MNNWTMILGEEKDALKAAGALWALGYLAVIRLKAAGGESLLTTTRELAALWDMGNYRSVKRTLNALSKAGLLRVESSANNTKIFLARGVQKSPSKVSSERTQNEFKTNAERGQNERSTPFPPDPLNPKNETLIIKQQKKHIYSAQAAQSANNLQDFSDRVMQEFEDLKNDRQKGIWFKTNKRCLKDILDFCSGDFQLACRTIRVCAQRLDKAGFVGGYNAVRRNLPYYHDLAVKELAKG